MRYAETSALLAWLLGQPPGAGVGRAIAMADAVVTSELTLIECDRVLLRAVAVNALTPPDALAMQQRLAERTDTWGIEPMSPAVIARARQPYPYDAIRALDAINVATALVVREAVPDLDVLSLDERVRANATALGFRVLPA